MWINSYLDFLAINRGQGEGEKDQWRIWEDQMAEKESLFPLVRFSCVFTSTHPQQTVPSGREFNLSGDEPSLPASFFAASLLLSLTSVLGLRRPSWCTTCACKPRTSLPFCIDWGSSTIVDLYCSLEVTQRVSRVEGLEPYILRQHSLSVRWIDWIMSHMSSSSEMLW